MKDNIKIDDLLVSSELIVTACEPIAIASDMSQEDKSLDSLLDELEDKSVSSNKER